MTKDTTLVTHEPKQPQDWPIGHVRVELTGSDESECVKIWIHGHTHYLHSTTARELAKMLDKCLDDYNKIARQDGIPGLPDV
jgi:calcineurin-like phosphoesterase family protein